MADAAEVIDESEGDSGMTAPPGGPYGQNPYGTNPLGQEPHWGGQQPSGPTPYPPGGAYPPPQAPPPGQAFPPGAPPPVPPPPGPPPRRPRSKLPWLIGGGVAVLAVVALVVVLVFTLGDRNKPTTAAPPATTSSPAPSQPNNSQQIATDCTKNVSAGPRPSGNRISAGRLWFPSNVAPGWSPVTDDQSPNLIGAVGIAQEVPGIKDWVMEAEVAITNFVPTMDITAQATKLIQCIATGPGYADATPTLGPLTTAPMTIDGVKATRVDGDISIADSTRNTKGDSVTVIAVDTKPVTVFVGARPIGDPGNAATINQVIAALKVSKRG